MLALVSCRLSRSEAIAFFEEALAASFLNIQRRSSSSSQTFCSAETPKVNLNDPKHS